MSQTKRALIDKANVSTVIIVSIATFVTVFSLVSVKALWSQRSYQARVIEARDTAHKQLVANLDASEKLTDSYEQFVAAPENVIGGSTAGSGERDGDNARIILDALPSKYDFPALTTSLEKLIKSQNLVIASIAGKDEESQQQNTASSASPKAIEMPFKIGVKGSYDSIQKLVTVFERSIRPFDINQLEFKAGQGSELVLEIDAKTYYQPERGFQFKNEVVQ